ncbi:MAG: cyclopropane-fatty-acyl-phospholipid synthase family protein [Planctomycetota bacterium]
MSPDRSYAEHVRSFYEDAVALHGFTFKGLGYNNEESQRRRFEALVQVGDLRGARILDVGCGLGDLAAFLRACGVAVDYTGIDICEHLIQRATERFAGPGSDSVRFATADVLAFDSEPFDYVLSSGIFGLWTPGTASRIAPTLEKLLSLAGRAVAVNFLSLRAPKQAARSLYLEPTELLAQALSLTPAVSLRHDYLPNDFTLYLYREPRWPQLG